VALALRIVGQARPLDTCTRRGRLIAIGWLSGMMLRAGRLLTGSIEWDEERVKHGVWRFGGI
jgi:hypothetical protein